MNVLEMAFVDVPAVAPEYDSRFGAVCWRLYRIEPRGDLGARPVARYRLASDPGNRIEPFVIHAWLVSDGGDHEWKAASVAILTHPPCAGAGLIAEDAGRHGEAPNAGGFFFFFWL